jgi:hypothetical protein
MFPQFNAADNLDKRAAAVIGHVQDELLCANFLRANHITTGNYLMNMAFVAELFKKFPGVGSKTTSNNSASSTSQETRYRDIPNKKLSASAAKERELRCKKKENNLRHLSKSNLTPLDSFDIVVEQLPKRSNDHRLGRGPPRWTDLAEDVGSNVPQVCELQTRESAARQHLQTNGELQLGD